MESIWKTLLAIGREREKEEGENCSNAYPFQTLGSNSDDTGLKLRGFGLEEMMGP